MNEPALWGAVFIALLASVVGPCLLSWLNARQRRAEMAQQAIDRAAEAQRGYDREDAVAHQAAEAARLLAAAQAVAAVTADETLGTLKVIHTLVNSNMSAQIQATLDEAKAALILMQELADMRLRDGHDPSELTLAEIEAKKLRIAELEATMAERKVQDELVREQASD